MDGRTDSSLIAKVAPAWMQRGKAARLSAISLFYG